MIKKQKDRFSSFTMYGNDLPVGEHVHLHKHKNDHLGVLPGGWRYRLVTQPPGESVSEKIIDVPVGGVALVGIPAPWIHDIFNEGRSDLPPLAAPSTWCVFSDYDRNGKFLPNPMEGAHD